jgi:hypothetical protein
VARPVRIIELVNRRLNRVLRIAQAALPEGQFQAFRSAVLWEFGRQGFEYDLERLLSSRQENNKQGSGWHIRRRKEVDYE